MDTNRDYQAATIDGRAVMHSELSEAFDMVKNSEHWKNPIDATIEWPGTSTLKVILEAIRYFTATEPSYSCQSFRTWADGTQEQETIWITADGYYAGPAN